MKPITRIVSAATIAALTILAASNTHAAKVKPVLLKVPIAFSTSLPALGTPIKWVGENIAELSNGTVKMKVYEPGKLVAPFEILDAVSTGKVNAGYTTAERFRPASSPRRWASRSFTSKASARPRSNSPRSTRVSSPLSSCS